MKEIVLTGGFHAIVDNEDYKELNRWKWCCLKSKNGIYAKRRKPGPALPYKLILMHRDILKAKPGQMIDHINGNGLDNRRQNLRFCSPMQNARHKTKLQLNNKSGTTGVSWDKMTRKWRAQISVKRKSEYIGIYKRKYNAIKARKDRANLLFKEFAPLV